MIEYCYYIFKANNMPITANTKRVYIVNAHPSLLTKSPNH